MPDTTEIAKRLDDAESRLAYLLGTVRGMGAASEDHAMLVRQYERLRQTVAAEAVAVMPYLGDAD